MIYKQLEKLCFMRNTTPTAFVKDILGLSSSKVTAWKNGSIPKYEILLKIANYFDVSIGYLFDGEKKSPSPELTGNEQEALEAFKELHKDDQNLAIGYMKGLAAKYDHEAEAKENAS